MNDVHRTIVFFDGECLLCNRTLLWIVRNEKSQKMVFAPLKGIQAQMLLEEYDALPDSIIVHDGMNILTKSHAILHICKEMGGIWNIIHVIMKIIPKGIRDILYDIIAKNRYVWFGTTQECLLKNGPHNNRCLD